MNHREKEEKRKNVGEKKEGGEIGERGRKREALGCLKKGRQ